MIFVAAVSTIIELEVLVVLREWYRDRAARKRAEEREKGREEGYKEGFEAGLKAAEREVQAATSGNSSEKNGED